MLPTDFPERNKVYTKPEGWMDEECMDLPVWAGQYKDLPAWEGYTSADEEKTKVYPIVISCWKLSKEDMEEIQRTGHIWLSITGMGMPPVSLFTEHPFNPEQ